MRKYYVSYISQDIKLRGRCGLSRLSKIIDIDDIFEMEKAIFKENKSRVYIVSWQRFEKLSFATRAGLLLIRLCKRCLAKKDK